MAVKFTGDLQTLIRDLESRGFHVRDATLVKGAPGRTADVFLHNGVVVRWDAYSQALWTDGPPSKSVGTETSLRFFYEGGLIGRVWTLGVWNFVQTFNFVRKRIVVKNLIRIRTQGKDLFRKAQRRIASHAPEQPR